MGVDTALNKIPDVAEELRSWRTDVLNILLTIATAISALVVAFAYMDSTRHPERWPVTLAYMGMLLIITMLTVGRRIDHRVRMWGLVTLGYIAGTVSLVVGGLAGDGRVYLLTVPVLTLILVGAKQGLVMGILCLLTYLATAVATSAGWLADVLFIQENPISLAAWLQEGAVIAMCMVLLVVMQYRFSRFLSGLADERASLSEMARTSEHRYRVLSELTSDFAYAIELRSDGSLGHPWVTEAFARSAGYSLEEVRENGWMGLVHQNDLPLAEQAFRTLVSGKPDVTELRLVSKQGDTVWVRNHGKPIWDDAEGRVTSIYGAAQNITQRKQAEAALQGAYEDLELRVQERTADLAQANKELQTEIAERKTMEQALRESEEKYRSLVELVPDPVIVVQGDQLCFASPAFSQLFGYTQQDIDDGLSIFSFLQEQDREEVVRRYQARVAGESLPSTYQIDAVAKDGSLIPCEASATLIQYQGQPANLAIVRDITERRRAQDELEARVEERTEELARANAVLEAEIAEREQVEEALRKSEEQFRLMAETSIDVIFQIDLEGKITYCSPALEQMTGVPAEEVIGAHLSDILASEELSKAQEAFDSASKGEQVRMLGLKNRTREGALLYMELSIVPIIQGDEVTGILGVARDVTAHRQAEEAVRESEKTIQALLNAPTEVMVLIDPRGTIKALNEACAQALGGTQAELIGKDVFDIFPPELTESRKVWLKKVVRTGEPVRFEDQRDGTWYNNRLYPIFNAEGQVTQLAVFAQDVTEQRQAEQQTMWSARLAAMGQMATALAHEINNPLQAIQNNLEMVMDFELSPEEQARYMQVVRTEIDRLIEINRRILDFARPADDSPVSVRVADLVQRTLDLVNKQLQRADVQLSTDLAPDLPPVVVAPNQIIQVLMNLILNATEAMSEGGHILATAQADDGDGMISLALTNDGPHIPEEHIARLFDPFFTTKPDSTGLGLTVSFGIVQRHGGTIDVRNLEGDRGVVFTILLPTDHPS